MDEYPGVGARFIQARHGALAILGLPRLERIAAGAHGDGPRHTVLGAQLLRRSGDAPFSQKQSKKASIVTVTDFGC